MTIPTTLPTGHYRHKKLGFVVVAGPAAWWDMLGKKPGKTVEVVLTSMETGRNWTLSRASFDRLYEPHELPRVPNGFQAAKEAIRAARARGITDQAELQLAAQSAVSKTQKT